MRSNNEIVTKTARGLLAQTVSHVIQESIADGSARSRRDWAIRQRLDIKVVERVIKPDGPSPSVHVLDDIARACGMHPWQLLCPDPRFSRLSERALLAAAELDAIPEGLSRERAYSFVQGIAAMGNPGGPASRGPSAADGSGFASKGGPGEETGMVVTPERRRN